MIQSGIPPRPIRSYVLRAGRTTPSQRRALETLLPVYGLALPAPGADPVDFHAAFGRRAPLVLEIGFGAGEALVEMAARDPVRDFIGVEVHPPGVGRLLSRLRDREIDNVRVFQADAIDVLSHAFAPASLAKVCLFFPDPWPKKKHHKRRLLQRPFLEAVCEKLEDGGVLHFATDWRDYAEAALELIDGFAPLHNLAGPGAFHPGPPPRPVTRFEQRGLRLGHGVWDIQARKSAG